MARIEHRMLPLEVLVGQIRSGELRVPRFQRPFVWDRKKILKLLDSLSLRYPIGTPLIWRTSERYSSFDRIGPIDLTPDQPKAPVPVGYVLDGHQRLATLMGCLALGDTEAAALKGKDRIFLVYYDLKEREFVHHHAAQLEVHHLPVVYLLRSSDRDLFSWLDQQREKCLDGKVGSEAAAIRDQWNIYRTRAATLQMTIGNYVLPYHEVTEATVDEAVEIFERLNSQGAPARRMDVFAALTWKQGGFDFTAAASRLVQSHPAYSNFGIEPILRALLACLGEDIYRKDWQAVKQEHKNRFEGAMDEVAQAFPLAIEFLGERLGATSGRVVPYAFHLVLLTEFFRRRPKATPEMALALERWFWATSFSAAYTTGSRVEFNDDLARARLLAGGDDVDIVDRSLTLKAFPRNFHPKSARVRALHLFLKTLKPRAFESGTPILRLLDNGMADARQIEGTGTRLAGRLLVGSGYRTLKPTSISVVYEDLLIDRAEVFASHALPENGVAALMKGEIEVFLQQREDFLIDLERNFAKAYVIIPDGADDRVEEEPEVDVDDETAADLT